MPQPPSLAGPACGYRRKWKILPERKEERKTLVANASVARLLWLMAEADR